MFMCVSDLFSLFASTPILTTLFLPHDFFVFNIYRRQVVIRNDFLWRTSEYESGGTSDAPHKHHNEHVPTEPL